MYSSSRKRWSLRGCGGVTPPRIVDRRVTLQIRDLQLPTRQNQPTMLRLFTTCNLIAPYEILQGPPLHQGHI